MKVYASNTNDRTEYDKYYYEKNKEKIIQNKHDKRIDNPLYYKFMNIITNCIRTDLKFKRNCEVSEYIDIPYLNQLYNIQDRKCYYRDCNCELDLETNMNVRKSNTLCIGRLDKSLGFTKDNSVLCCFSCNNMNMAKYYVK